MPFTAGIILTMWWGKIEIFNFLKIEVINS
jgi:hypothetical protein